MQLSNDSSIDDLSSITNTTISKCGLSGNSTIVPLASNSEIFWMQSQRSFLESFYHSLWVCRNVIETRPMQMGSAWGKLITKNDDRDKIDACNKWMRSLTKRYIHGQISANLFGGSTMIRLVDDGRNADEPIDKDRIKQVRYTRILDRWELYPDPLSYHSQPGNPEYYLLAVDPSEMRDFSVNDYNLPRVEAGYLHKELYPSEYTYFRVHKDRVTRFDGDYISTDALKHNQGWYASTLVPFLSPCLRYLETIGYVSAATKTFEFTLFLVDNLYSMLSSAKGREQITEKSRLNQQQITAINSMLADKKTEDVKIVSRNFSNVDNIIDKLKEEMQGAANLDEIELWGKHPKGLNSTGQSERLEKARKIKEACSYKWNDAIEGSPSEDKIGDLELYLLSDESPFNGLPDDFSWEWNTEIAITPEEKAQIYTLYSQGDQNYIQSKILAPAELRSRFDGDNFADNVIINDELFNEMNEENKQAEINKNKQTELKINQLKGNNFKSEDGVKKLVLEPGNNEVLPESEFELLVREIEGEY